MNAAPHEIETAGEWFSVSVQIRQKGANVMQFVHASSMDGCYPIDGFSSDMKELFRIGFKFPESQKGE